MRKLSQLLNRLRTLIGYSQKQSDLELEIQHHIHHLKEDFISEGYSETEALSMAQKRFGNAENLKEECRDAWGVRLISDISRDVKYALRALKKDKGFSFAVILTLALALGANTTALSGLYHLLSKPLPFPEADRIVQIFNIGRNNPDGKDSGSSWKQYSDYKERKELITECVVSKPLSKIINYADTATIRLGRGVSEGYFDFFGVRPAVGRFFSDEEITTKSPVLVLNYNEWKNNYDSDPGVIGDALTIGNGLSYTIVGVAPKSIQSLDNQTQFFVPFEVNPAAGRYGNADLWIKPIQETNLARLHHQLKAIEQQWYDEIASQSDRAHRNAVFESIEIEFQHPLSRFLWIIEIASLFVLLIACLNVGNLMLSRANQKWHDTKIRYQLGVRLRDLARYLLIESTTLTFIASLVGLGFTFGALSIINRYLEFLDPNSTPIRLDSFVLAFVFTILCIVSVLTSIFPITIIRTKASLSNADNQSRSTQDRFSKKLSTSLLITQIAFAFTLLVGSSMLLRSFLHVMAVEPGFDASNIVKGRIEFQTLRSFYKRREFADLRNQILEQMKSIPGVESASISQYRSFQSYNAENLHEVVVQGQSGVDPHLYVRHLVTPEYFETMGIPILQGRAFSNTDQKDAVYVVDELFAREIVKKDNAIGIEISPPGGGRWAHIIGVSKRANLRGLEQRDGLPIAYSVIHRGHRSAAFTILLRSSRTPEAIIQEMTTELRKIDPRLPLSDVQTLDESLEQMLVSRKSITLLLILFSTLALTIAIVGTYASIAYDVGTKTKEISIRKAVGANNKHIIVELLTSAMNKTILGAVLGVIISMCLTRYLKTVLFDIETTDFMNYLPVTLSLIVLAAVASYIPSRKTLSFKPAQILNQH